MGENRQNATTKAIDAVWIRAAGHCELCSKDLTQDRITLTQAKLGQVAHILPASPDGPRATDGHTVKSAALLTSDPGNLMLLCASCHVEIDKTPEGYPAQDLTTQHEVFLAAIRFAVNHAKANLAVGLIILGKHFPTPARIEPSQLQAAMWRDCLRPIRIPLVIELPELSEDGRDDHYYRHVRHILSDKILRELSPVRSDLGDEPWIGVAGLADIPSLMILGQVLGDRRRRKLYSPNRQTGLHWPDPGADLPIFSFNFDENDNFHPIALVISISAEVPGRDVLTALPGANIARFSSVEHGYSLIKNERAISHFRDEVQKALSHLEACTADPIHVFAAIPAAMAIEFGALLSTNHQHGYLVYDREPPNNFFRCHISLTPVQNGAA